MPATGHALGLTSLPSVLLKLFGDGPIYDTLRSGQEIFCDATLTQAIVVSLPEPLAVQEALELIAGLDRDNVAVGATVVNQMTSAPFSLAEKTLLEEATLGKNYLGRHTLSRSSLSKQAVARLRANTSIPMIEVPRFAFGNVVTEIANSLVAS